MAVKVWLPLSGDTTTNKGLSTITTTVTGTATYASGILGGKSFTSGAASVGFTLAGAAPAEFTVSFWVKEGVGAATGTSIFAIGTAACQKTSTGYEISDLASGDLFTLTSGWNHVAITATGNKVLAYVNGVAQDEVTQSGSLSANSAVVIGGDWAGNIEEFKILDKAMSKFEAYSEAQGLVINYGFNGVQSLGAGVSLPTGTTAADWGFGVKEYDLSGNEFDATYGTIKPSNSSDSAIYSSAMDFTGADALTSPVIDTTQLVGRYTVNVWAKASGEVATFTAGATLSASDATGWHMYTATSDGTLYVDGVEDTSGDATGLITSSAENGLTIGGSLGGAISDFRLYATEFTADEVLALYKRRVSVDNFGKVIASEFIATDDVLKPSFSKKGIVSAPAIANYAMDNEEAVNVTKFNITAEDGALNAVDVIEL